MELLGTYILNNSPEELFSLIIGDNSYTIRQLWNTIGFWTIDIFDEQKVVIISGIKLVSGIFLLNQYPELNFDILIDTRFDISRNDLDQYPLQVYLK
jgi:hypothetical protein